MVRFSNRCSAYREDGSERLAFSERHSSQVIARSSRIDSVELFQRRCTENIENETDLVVVITTWEHGSSGEHFSQNATDGPANETSCQVVIIGKRNADVDPHINGFCVLLEGQHDLRSSVPSRGHILFA